MICIKNGRIHDAVREEPYIADLLINNGKIAAIGENLSAEGCEMIDAAGLDVFPGFIDAHTHIGLFGAAGLAAKDDVEKYQRCTPENRVIDAVDPLNPDFERARRGGVTTICDSPGSVNCIGGTALAMKTYGIRIDDMVIKNPAAMKMALGENPKAKLLTPLTTRMTVSACIRRELHRARDYMVRKEAAAGDPFRTPAYDEGLEALIPVIKGELPVKVHCHRTQDIFSAIRLAKEFNLKMTLEHATDGGLIAEALSEEGYPICAGPYGKSDPRSTVAMIKAGCQVCVMTDYPVVPQRNLSICAGLLIREGLSEFEALKTITINAAKHLGIETRVGSIEVGKDADLVLAKGNPMTMGQIQAVFIDGVIHV